MSLNKKNLEREITQAIASKLVTSQELSANVLHLISSASAKLAAQLQKQFEKEKKSANRIG